MVFSLPTLLGWGLSAWVDITVSVETPSLTTHLLPGLFFELLEDGPSTPSSRKLFLNEDHASLASTQLISDIIGGPTLLSSMFPVWTSWKVRCVFSGCIWIPSRNWPHILWKTRNREAQDPFTAFTSVFAFSFSHQSISLLPRTVLILSYLASCPQFDHSGLICHKKPWNVQFSPAWKIETLCLSIIFEALWGLAQLTMFQQC